MTIGDEIFCIDCCLILGIAGSERQRTKLLHGHACQIRTLLKQPASPPPYN
jgi:hypothetical protein